MRRCVSVSIVVCALAVAAANGCSSYTEPHALTLNISGAVRHDGTLAPAAGVGVLLVDRRSSFETGYVLRSTVTNASGQYQLTAAAQRPGREPGCEFVVVHVEGYEYSSARGVTCTSDPQTIDLTILTF